MDEILYLSPNSTVAFLQAVEQAATQHRSFRIITYRDRDGQMYFKFKIGEGLWSPPMLGDPDPLTFNS